MVDPPDAELFLESGGKGDLSAVAARLEELRAAIATELPGVRVPFARFVRELAARATETGLEAVDNEGAIELALACACADHDTRALALF